MIGLIPVIRSTVYLETLILKTWKIRLMKFLFRQPTSSL